MRTLLAFVMLLAATGCSGVKAVPGVTSEKDVVVSVAYDYLLETNALDRTYEVRGSALPVYQDSFPVYPPPPPLNPPWTQQWQVSFDVFDSFGNPVGEFSVRVRRFDEAGEVRYEVGT